MHDGCSGSFEEGKQVLDKVRAMGFSNQPMPMPLYIKCGDCKEEFEMVTFEDKCPHCGEIHCVTPCHAFDPDNVASAGKEN